MESVLSLGVSGFCCPNMKPLKGWLGESKGILTATRFNNSCSFGDVHGQKQRRMVVVKAEGVSSINPDIRKSEDKVVDSVLVTELSKPLTAYCRDSSVVQNVVYLAIKKFSPLVDDDNIIF